MKKYKFSIIIPHKNIPSLLQRCLDSIPQRNDIQIIIVDDNSNPEVVDFDCFPGVNRQNTEVYFDKTGKGAGRARNIGLEHAVGEWIIFADADDMFEIGIDSIFNKLYIEKADLIYFDVISRDSNSGEMTDESKEFSKMLYSREMFTLRYKLLTPWMKAIRKSMVDNNNIRFEEVICGNDTRFSALCGYYAKKIMVYEDVGYCWMQRNDSLWRKRDKQWYVIRYGVSLRIAKFMRRKNEFEAESFFLESALFFINTLIRYSSYEYFKGVAQYNYAIGNYKSILFIIPRFVIWNTKKVFKKDVYRKQL